MNPSSPSPDWAVHLPAGTKPSDVDLLADQNLPGRWRRRWLETPSAQQLQDIDGSWLSSEELEDRTRRVAYRLLAGGASPGDRFLLSGAPSAAWIVAYMGAVRAGLITVPMNTAYTRHEVTRIVRDSRPTIAAVDDSQRAQWIQECSQLPIRVLGLDVDLPDGATADIDQTSTADPALLIYTSGTTGQPKGALLSHGNLLASATAINLAWGWRADDRLLLMLPLFHLHGLGVGLNGTLCAGASLILRPRFDIGEIVAQGAQGASLFFGVPTMYQRLVSSGEAPALGQLRLLVSGSAPLPESLAHDIGRAAGQIPLERYGMTETVILTSNPYDGPRKPGTVGLPLPGVELRLDGSGEVEVRGPSVIAGYFDQPEATMAALSSDGWFRTGDLGAIDTDGYLRLVGRSKELIITGGYNVHPREVEEALGLHPDVREVAVIGRPSEQWGEEVTAVVVVERIVTVDALRAHAALHLAPYKVPKRIEFVDKLPRNPLGKVMRREL